MDEQSGGRSQAEELNDLDRGKQFDGVQDIEDFSGELAALDGDYAAAKAEEYDPLPDGEYTAAVANFEIERAKSSGRLQAKWTLEILGPTHAHRKVFKRSGLTQESLPYFKRDLLAVGIKDLVLSDLRNRIPEIKGQILSVRLLTNDKGQQVYLNRARA